MRVEMPVEGRRRVAIVDVEPAVDAGRRPSKGEVGLPIQVRARLVADGHDRLRAWCRWRGPDGGIIARSPLLPGQDDWWSCEFTPAEAGRHSFSIQADVDRFESWRRAVASLHAAGTLTAVDLAVGTTLLESLLPELDAQQRADLMPWVARLLDPDLTNAARAALHLDLAELAATVIPPRFAAESAWYAVQVDPLRARFSAWYECFPRSSADDSSRSGTLSDLMGRLPYIADMGFDVLYLPPVHPIGRAFRKGPNNTLAAQTHDPGSPWAIGSAEGGHTAIHPDLGTLEDFHRLVDEARRHGLDLALDLALQCSPDHPWVTRHPEWFKKRPDGTIQYAENPPKRYQDIYPFDFESDDWPALWQALREVVQFWIAAGVRWFRVDNPHTKPLSFWEWLIAAVRQEHPDVLFLAEAFTRPTLMYELAKVGFTQSYTYFTWRNTAAELRQYLEEINRPPVSYFFRPNFFTNTPDILPLALQTGVREVFLERAILAATLSPSYGVYGPAFELMEHVPLMEGGEEYRDSEKYEVRHWNWARPDSLAPELRRLNQIRREHPALWWAGSLVFHEADSNELLVYSKRSPDGGDTILVVVSLDPVYTVAGYVHLNLPALGLSAEGRYLVHDLLTDDRYIWSGEHNYVELRPGRVPAHVFHVTFPLPSERDFDGFR